MILTREHMLERFYARDRDSDGRFLTGVVTTGIYCLPSCTARKPLPENIRFFDSESEARAAGLRPCRRCRPHHFYERYDPDLHLLETLVADVRRRPARFPDAAALVAASGIGGTKLSALFRRHLHSSPAGFLAQQRVTAASEALAEGGSVSEAAYAAGYESLSALHANFRRRTGLTPGEYRALGSSPEFTLVLPPGFRADVLLRVFGRDPDSRLERVRGSEMVKALVLDGVASLLHLRFEGRMVLCRVTAGQPPSAPALRAAHAATARM